MSSLIFFPKLIQMLSTLRAWLPAASLAIAAFVFNTSEFLPVGLLPDIAQGLGESLSFTGLVITGYAWVVALTSLPLALLTAKLERRRLLLTLMGIFAAAHLVMPWVTNFATLLGARIAVALSHAVFWSIMFPLAARMAPKGQKAKGIAAVMGGTVLATVLGVPIGTKLGHWFGWQEAFAIVGGAAIISMLLIAAVLPEAPSRKAGSISSLPVILKRPALRQLYLVAATAMLGNFTVYSYVSPIVTEAAGGSAEDVVTLLLVFGLSGFLGTILNTRILEKSTSLALVLPLAAMTTAFLFFLATSGIPAVHWVLVILWGASISGLMMSLNTLVLAAGHDAADISTSLLSGIINVGIGGGAFLGSLLSANWSFASLPYAGAVLAGAPLLAALFIWKTTGCAVLPYEHEDSVREHGQALDLESGRAAKTP